MRSKRDREYFNSFPIAGFSYYDGVFAFKNLKIGSEISMRLEPENIHDERAVELYFEDHKLGYVPRRENEMIHKLLNMGHEVFDARVQALYPQKHTEEQVRVIVYVVKAGR